MEIVTWVLDGELEHRDSTGTDGIIYPGLAQRMSAGSGIRHSEMNASATADVHLVQMWVLPDTEGIEPGYEQHDLSDGARRGGGLVVGRVGPGPRRARSRSTSATRSCSSGRLVAGEAVTVPGAPHAHVFVRRRRRRPRRARPLGTGDAARLTDAGSARR